MFDSFDFSISPEEFEESIYYEDEQEDFQEISRGASRIFEV